MSRALHSTRNNTIMTQQGVICLDYFVHVWVEWCTKKWIT
uniref:Uncharacterized protein n=1 Tax=Setaria italica TaxID=4555 RepID=K4A4B9_SETIT